MSDHLMMLDGTTVWCAKCGWARDYPTWTTTSRDGQLRMMGDAFRSHYPPWTDTKVTTTITEADHE